MIQRKLLKRIFSLRNKDFNGKIVLHFCEWVSKMKNRVYFKAFYEIEADRLGNCGNICRSYMYIIIHAFQ